MKLSIVTTLYGSSNYIEKFHARCTQSASKLTQSYEILMVDDGSPDDSLAKAKVLAERDPRLTIIELSRNFGHHRALMTGLEYANGELVFLIDSDLEEPPESLNDFWAELDRDKELDMVYGVQQEKSGTGSRKAFSNLFYKIFNFFSFVKIPENELVSRLMTRRFVDALLLYREREIFIPGIWADVGFNVKAIRASKSFDGHSTYSLRKKVVMAVDAITSFSTRPLLYVFYLGTLVSAVSVLVIIYLILNKLFFGAVLGGWTSVLASLYLIGGVIVFSVGLVGIYLSKIFSEAKGRPNAIVRKIHKNGQ